MVLNGIYYPHKEMSRLPDDLQISNTKTKVVNNCRLRHFATQHSALSNMAPCKLKIDGVKYRSAEQAFQHAKAVFAGDHTQAQKILDTDDPYAAPALGKVINVPAWNPRKEGVLKKILTQKYIQCKKSQKALLAAGTTTLVECTLDPYWGWDIESKQIANGIYKGRNITGTLMQEVRVEIRDRLNAEILET